MLQRCAGFGPDILSALADLERRVLAVDGGRLKLEWNSLRTRPVDRVSDVLWWGEGGVLLGFVGIYQFGGSVPEITGMVDPAARRQGIAGALLDAAVDECRGRGVGRVLLLTPRQSAGGHALARSRHGTLDHSEHAMLLRGDPTDGPSDPRITLREARAEDAPVLEPIFGAAFDWTPPDLAEVLARNTDEERTVVIELDGTPVGTLRMTQDGDTGSIYGFAVDPPHQGQGIGSDVLRRVCRTLREAGMSRVTLEVAVENERALGLYTRVGFEPVTTEDYYALILG